MEEFEEVFKPNELHQRLQKSLGINSQLSEMLKDKDGTTKSILGISMASALSKKIQQHQRRFEYFNLAEIKTLANRLGSLSELVLPQSTIGILESLNRHQEDLQVGTSTLANVLRRQSIDLAQINNLSSALSSISVQFAEIALKQRNLDFINDFEELTEEIGSINERSFDPNGVTKEGLNEIKELLQRVEIKIDKIDSDANALFGKVLMILGLLLALIGETRNWLPKPEYATKLEVETVIKEQFSIFEKKLKEAKEFRITRRICLVMSKPSLKSLIIEKLPIDFEVTVLQVHHKWVLVSFIDLDDNLPQTGWIMKKYLDKP